MPELMTLEKNRGLGDRRVGLWFGCVGQLFGGNGYMSEYRVEQLARDAKSPMIYAGSNEV